MIPARTIAAANWSRGTRVECSAVQAVMDRRRRFRLVAANGRYPRQRPSWTVASMVSRQADADGSDGLRRIGLGR
jgi:hypothetical protein